MHCWLLFVCSFLQCLGARHDAFVKFKDQRQKLNVHTESVAHPYDVSQSIRYVQERFKSTTEHSVTLAVMMVFNFPLYSNGTHPRLDLLRCSLHKLYLHVGTTTPMDVYLWMNETSIPRLPHWFYAEFPEVFVVPIDENSWQIPTGISPPSTWSFINVFPVNYHIMGRWRLTYAFDFVHALGYKYMLQIDDDTLMMQSINFNIVDRFSSSGMAFGYRDKIYEDDPVVLLGLAELAKYWLVSRGVKSPPGTLFKHVSPAGLEGVSSAGWDRQLFIAAFMVINVDFWYEEPVQDFLHLVLSTGGETTQRWLEQAVINMISLLFLPEHSVYAFRNTDMIHEKVTNARTFRLLGCSFTPTAVLQGLDNESAAIVSSPNTSGGTAAVAKEVHHAVRDVEFLVAWEFVGMNTVNFQPSEVLLFHWQYNISSCGADTVELNKYFKTIEEVDFGIWMLPGWWDKYDFYGIHNRLFEHYALGHSVDSTVTSSFSECAQVLRSQLNAYVDFYCLYTASKQGERIVQHCDGIRNGALNAFDVQTVFVA